MLYRAENRSVFVEGCNFKIKCPKKLRPAGDYCHLKVSTLKVNFSLLCATITTQYSVLRLPRLLILDTQVTLKVDF